MPNIRRNKANSKRALQADPLHVYWSLVRAIEDDNDLELTRLLGQEELIELIDQPSLGGLLYRACELDSHISIVIALVNCCLNVNYADQEQSCSSLMMAAKNNNCQMVSLLIEVGAKVNATDKFGWTALFYASYFGALDCARALLDHGAHVNLTDGDQMSCLIWAAGRGHLDIAQLLIERGAFINATDRYNTNALIWASRKGHASIVELLIGQGAKVNERGMYGWTPLLVAVKGNHLETAKVFLAANADTGVCDSQLMSPLTIACKEGYKEIALELIKVPGTSVNLPDRYNNTPLIYATKLKCHRLVEALVAAGAYVEHSGELDRNAIHWSAINDDEQSCRMLLKQDVDLSLSNLNGETYLALAIKHRSLNVIKLLMENNDSNLNNSQLDLASLIQDEQSPKEDAAQEAGNHQASIGSTRNEPLIATDLVA